MNNKAQSQVRRTMHNRVFELWKQHELKEHRQISQAQLAREIGIELNTLKRWLAGDVTRYDKPVILAMMNYFDIDDVGQLIVVEKEPV